ncbi:MAG: diaminopimelate epimerase [Acidimicrobiia bacterium]
MRNLAFTKMQGLGNDFVVIDGPIGLSADEISELCDRRLGIGADGVLEVSRADSIGMKYWNADGSPAEMCGNGLRCVARYTYDKGWARDRNFPIQTPIGARGVKVLEDAVEAEIGRVKVTGHTEIDGDRYHLIDVGNPHAVLLVDDLNSTDVATIGPRVEMDPQFESRTNVEVASFKDGRVDMRVWERGVGETTACGTGMVAAAFVATKTNGFESPIVVETRGGEGQVEFRDGVAWLRGPAEYVFRGNVGER